MSLRKLVALVVVLGLLVSLGAGCGGKKAEQPTTKEPEKPKEMVLNYNMGADAKSLDPAAISAVNDSWVIMALFEGMVRNTPDGVKPGMATEWKISDDKKTYTFKLRDAKWTNGDPVTAGDFEFAWKRALDPRNAFDYAYQLYYIKGAEKYNTYKMPDNYGKDEKVTKETDEALKKLEDAVAVKAKDDKTLEVNLEAPTAYFLWLTSFQTYMPINKKAATANKDWHAKPETFVSNGPFKLDKWEHKSKIEVIKNPNYWDKGVVKLDRIVFTQVEEESTVLTMFETDKLDMTDNVPQPEIPRLKKEGKLKTQPILGTYYYAFNNQKPPFNNPKVRKAFAMAIDRQAIVENVTKGGQIPAFAWVPPGIPDAGGKDFRDYKPKYFEENAAEAKKLLAEAGYSDPSKFPEVELLYNTNEGHKAIAEAIMEMLKKNLGITKIKLTNQEWKVFQTTRTKGNYQLARDGWLGDYIDAMTFADLFVTTSGNNDPQYRNPAYDKLIDTAKKSDDPKVRSDAMHKAEDILFEDMAIMPIYYYVHLYLQKDYVKNVFQTSLEQIDFKWAYIDKK